MTDLPKSADRIDPRTQHFECGKKSLHVQVPLASLITASDALRAAQVEIERLRALLASAPGAINAAFGQANAEQQGLDKLAAKYDAKIHEFRFAVRAALTSKDQHHG